MEDAGRQIFDPGMIKPNFKTCCTNVSKSDSRETIFTLETSCRVFGCAKRPLFRQTFAAAAAAFIAILYTELPTTGLDTGLPDLPFLVVVLWVGSVGLMVKFRTRNENFQIESQESEI